MREYNLDSDAENIFLVNFSEIESRLDPYYHKSVFKQIGLKTGEGNFTTFKKEAVKIFSGITPKSKGSAYTSEILGIPFVRSGDFSQENIINFKECNHVLTDIHNSTMSNSKLKQGDLLIAIVGATIGKIGVYKYDVEANINQAIGAIRLNESFNPFFVQLYLNTNFGQLIIDRLKRPVARANINLEELSSIPVPIISIERQNEIIDIFNLLAKESHLKRREAKSLLSSIDDYLLAELDIELPEIDNSLENRIFEVSFGQLESRQDPYFYIKEFQEIENNIEDSEWPIYHLKDIFEINRGGSPRPIHNYYTDDDDGLNWIRIGDTKSDSKYITQTSRKIKPSGARSSRKVVPGDFLLSNSMSFGRPYIMKIEGYIHDGWLLFRPKTELVNQDFLHSMLSSKLIYRLFSKATIGGVVENLNIDLVKNIKIPLPFLEKQNEIADHISNIRQAAQQLEQEANEIMENAKAKVERLILGQ